MKFTENQITSAIKVWLDDYRKNLKEYESYD